MSFIDSKSILRKNNKPILIKVLALLSIARWYNISLILISLYFSQIFIFDTSKRFLLTLQSLNIHLYVFSILFIIMGGYLINAFYDFEKDMINQPNKTYFGRLISKKTCLNIYLLFNVIGISLGLLISKEILIFNFLLCAALWIYSHKLRKKALLGEISASLLMISFFIGLSVLNWRIDMTLLLFSTYIFTIDLTREITKKMITLKGDLIVGEKSIPILFGIRKAKYIIFFLMLSSLFAILFLLPTVIHQLFSYYFIIAFIIILFSIYLLHNSKIAAEYEKINSIYKSLIGLAILSIVLY